MPVPNVLEEHDLHFIFDGKRRTLKIFDAWGKLRHEVEARGTAVRSGYGKRGKCPPGAYMLGAPVPVERDVIEYGEFYIPLIDLDGHMAEHDRDGIYIHGGGTGLDDPLADMQGWQITWGCIRVQNKVLKEILVPAVKFALKNKGKVYLTVTWD